MTTYAIDFGHGTAFDGGAVGIRREEDLIVEVGNLVVNYLKVLGHKVVEVRPARASSLTDSLQQRCFKANNLRCDIFVSIHFNAYNGQVYGTEVCYFSKAGQKVGLPVVNEIAKLGFNNRGMKYRDNLYVLKRTNMPAILIEGCFIDSARDMRLFNAPAMARAIVKGLTGKDVQNPKSNCKC